jgi:hypothetical protein
VDNPQGTANLLFSGAGSQPLVRYQNRDDTQRHESKPQADETFISQDVIRKFFSVLLSIDHSGGSCRHESSRFLQLYFNATPWESGLWRHGSLKVHLPWSGMVRGFAQRPQKR